MRRTARRGRTRRITQRGMRAVLKKNNVQIICIANVPPPLQHECLRRAPSAKTKPVVRVCQCACAMCTSAQATHTMAHRAIMLGRTCAKGSHYLGQCANCDDDDERNNDSMPQRKKSIYTHTTQAAAGRNWSSKQLVHMNPKRARARIGHATRERRTSSTKRIID